MTWSLQLKNGDLGINGSQLATVQNEQKMLQDLRCQFMQTMGTDMYHPEYGSLIDGGTTPEGVIHESLIGNTDLTYLRNRLQSEIIRIVNDYQSRQLSRAKADRVQYNRTTLTYREVVKNIGNIEIRQYLDKLFVKVTLVNLNGNEELLEFVFGSVRGE